MDHLPEISRPAYVPPEIPCLCFPSDYDGHGVTGFPERVGWRLDRIQGPLREDDKKSTIESAGALLQAWLYFGMLSDVFKIGEIEYNLHDFVEIANGRSIIRTDYLREYLDKLAKKAEGGSEEEHSRRQILVTESLRLVFGVFEINWDAPIQFGRWRISSILSLDTLMSIVILGETFKNAAAQIWPVSSETSPLKTIYHIRPQNPLRERLLKLGWCPNESMMLYNELDSTGLYLATLLERPFSQRLQHKNCSDEQCLALQTSDDTYQTKHTDNCPGNSSCMAIDLGQEKTSSILYKGGIPIITVPFFPEDGKSPKVEVLDYCSEKMKFVAISHVWGHGIGNPNANSLPSCQIVRLKELSAKASPVKFIQPAFWIDTLCIPVGSKHKTARKLAIVRIAKTFQEACRVLVLDADLQRCSRLCSGIELATRLLASGWMRRLWTLQEAVMSDKAANASKLDIQFLGSAIEFNSIAGKSVQNLYHTQTAMTSIFSAFPQYKTRDRTFAFLTRALKYRTTSKKEDEAVCLAPLLGFEQDQVRAIVNEATAEERMQMMYSMMGDIPASVLFHKLKKLEKPAFGWAPASLLSVPIRMDFANRIAARCDASGLHVQYAGFIVKTDLNLRLQRPEDDRFFIGQWQDSFPRAMITSEPRYHHREVYLAVVDFIKLMKTALTPAVIINPRDASESVLVSVVSEDDEEIHAEFLRNVQARFWSDASKFNAKAYGDWRDRLIDVREVSSSQKWCIR